MSDSDETLTGRELWFSAEGVVRAGSLSVDQTGAFAILVMTDGDELPVRGEGEPFAELVWGAAERGGTVLFQGHLRGSAEAGTRHLSVRVEGPISLTGTVSKVYRSAEGEPPEVGIWMIREVPDETGGTHKIGTGVNVRGADAEAIFDLRAGDRVSVEARHAPDGFLAVSPVTVLDASGPDEPAA